MVIESQFLFSHDENICSCCCGRRSLWWRTRFVSGCYGGFPETSGSPGDHRETQVWTAFAAFDEGCKQPEKELADAVKKSFELGNSLFKLFGFQFAPRTKSRERLPQKLFRSCL